MNVVIQNWVQFQHHSCVVWNIGYLRCVGKPDSKLKHPIDVDSETESETDSENSRLQLPKKRKSTAGTAGQLTYNI